MTKVVYLKAIGLKASSRPKSKTGSAIKSVAGKSLARSKAKAGAARKTLGDKIVLNSEGQRQKLRTLDARSETFGEDFGYAFTQNVKKARKENTRVIGRPDIAVNKH
jgi:hypothetical protein